MHIIPLRKWDCKTCEYKCDKMILSLRDLHGFWRTINYPPKRCILCAMFFRDNVQQTKQMCLTLKQGITIYIHNSNVEKHVVKLSLDWHINNCRRRFQRAKYCDLLVVSRSIIYWSWRLRKIILICETLINHNIYWNNWV